MFELPEYATLTRQFNETLKGKVVKEGSLGRVTFAPTAKDELEAE